MKFSVNRELLLKPLQQVAGVVERRQTLPVLSNVLIQVVENSVSLTGTDLEVELIGQVNDKDQCSVREPISYLPERVSLMEF